MPGKLDWLARSLPTEGDRAGDPRVGECAHDDVVTCGLDAPVAEVLEQIEDSPYGFALVLADGIILGRLRRSAIQDAAPDATAEDVMTPGPSTVRPDTAIDELRETLEEKDLKTAIVSTPEGRLMGVVRRKDLES